MATAYLKGPRPYTLGGDFSLWMRRFEAYAQAAAITEKQLPNALLSLLDDAAFRAFDLLGLTPEDTGNYKALVKALAKRFAPSSGEPELRFQLGQRRQQPTETIDEFADSLLDLTNRAYPDLEPAVRMHLARDRFIAGVKADYVQEHLLQNPPSTLDEARSAAKRLEAARTTRKHMQAAMGPATSSYAMEFVPKEAPPTEVAATSHESGLLEAVRKNTETLQELMQQMTKLQLGESSMAFTGRASARRGTFRRRQPLVCWKCGEPGHLRRDCQSGNWQWPVGRANYRPREL